MISSAHWKQMSPEHADLIGKVKNEIHSIVPGAEIILYGSHARGNADQYSDWDLLILVDQPLDRNLITKIRDCLYELELKADTVLSSIIRVRKDWYSPQYNVLPLKKAIEQEGVLL
jgi:predicted nucleotidyltransferase